MKEIRLELLIGTKVRDVDGKLVGRIEEIRGERRDAECLVEAYLVGESALVERLAAWKLVRPIRRLLGKRLYRSRRVPWEMMNLSDPKRPAVTVRKEDIPGGER